MTKPSSIGQPDNNADRQRDELLRRALATPPSSNEDILKRPKASRGKRTKVSDAHDRFANISIEL